MTLIRFTDAQLHELMQAARMVPPDLRDVFLERVAVELQGKPLGDGLVHRVAYNVARAITWDAERTAATGRWRPLSGVYVAVAEHHGLPLVAAVMQ
jgi:hypothetical protein